MSENEVLNIPPIPPVEKPKKKRIRLTPKQRAAKIAAGWNPPGPRPAVKTPHVPLTIEEIERGFASYESPAIALLKSLVDKLVLLENNAQYRSVWRHYFQHGGVFNGPRYTEELQAAIQYLIGVDGEKNTR